MSYSIQFQGPFVKKFYSSSYEAGRTSENPLFGDAFDVTVKTPHRRIYLLIQNQGNQHCHITFPEGGAVSLYLAAGASVSFDNFNAGFESSAEVKVFEAFA